MNHTHIFRKAFGIGGVLVVISSAAAQGGAVVGLGVVPEGTASKPRAISRDGTTVVGNSNIAPLPATPNVIRFRAFRWTAGTGMQSLGTLDGNADLTSDAFGVSADGSVVVGECNTGLLYDTRRAFVWTVTGGMVDIGAGSGVESAGARGVNATGTTVVGQAFYPGQTSCGFRWTASGGLIPVPVGASSMFSQATHGEALGGVALRGTKLAFNTNLPLFMNERAGVYDFVTGVTTQLGPIAAWSHPFAISVATGISDDGRTVVGYNKWDVTNFDECAVRWVNGGPAELLGPDPTTTWRYSSARACSADASRIGGSLMPLVQDSVFPMTTQRVAAFWTKQTGMVRLQDYLPIRGISMADWRLDEVTAVSADGLTLAGEGFHIIAPDQVRSETWLVRLPTPCGTADIAAMGGSIGPDGLLTADDIIAFLDAFFTSNTAVADVAGLGGGAPDGVLTADDVVAFLMGFFGGCP